VDRIAIIGCGGSGKSTLARQLARILDVPVVHLDALYYSECWTPPPGNEFAARQAELTAGERWIIEGNYASTLPIRLAAADTVIFLDLPAAVCLLGVATRRWRYRGGQHRADGAFDRITWNFVRYILGYRRLMRPRVRSLLQKHGPHVRLITLTSRRQVNGFIDRTRLPPVQRASAAVLTIPTA
jgi:adenylate kinase family enzyme